MPVQAGCGTFFRKHLRAGKLRPGVLDVVFNDGGSTGSPGSHDSISPQTVQYNVMRQKRNLENFLVLRLVIVFSGFILIELWKTIHNTSRDPQMHYLLNSILGLYFLEAVASLFWVHWTSGKKLFVALQVSVDLLMEGLMVALTGGPASLFCPLLFATLFGANTVMGFRGSMVSSSAATIILAFSSLISHVEGASISSIPSSIQFNTTDPWRAAAYLFTYGLAFHCFSVLHSRFAGHVAQAENLTEEIIDAMGESMVAVDKNGRIMMLNREAYALFGLDPFRLYTGKKVRDVFNETSYETLLPFLLNKQEKGPEKAALDVGGKTIPVEIATSLLKGPRHKVRGTITLVRDISLQQKMDEAAKQIARLEELNELARGIAHEVRNPLASMCGCAEEIAKDRGVSEDTNRLISILDREAIRVEKLIERFLDYARIHNVEKQRLELNSLLSDVVILLEKRAVKERQVITLTAPPALPAVSGDRNLLMQLFLNLGINAIEALESNSGTIQITASAACSPFFPPGPEIHAEEGVQVTISDTGCGIAAENLEKIFTPFYSGKNRGTGLGLAIAHRIVHIHGGTVDVRSQPGKGSVFRVWLPADRIAADDCGQNREREAVWM